MSLAANPFLTVVSPGTLPTDASTSNHRGSGRSTRFASADPKANAVASRRRRTGGTGRAVVSSTEDTGRQRRNAGGREHGRSSRDAGATPGTGGRAGHGRGAGGAGGTDVGSIHGAGDGGDRSGCCDAEAMAGGCLGADEAGGTLGGRTADDAWCCEGRRW